METNKLEYIGAFNQKDAVIIKEHFALEDIEYFNSEDESVHHGNSPFDPSPGRSSDIEIQKIFVHNRDVKKAVAICERFLGGTNLGPL